MASLPKLEAELAQVEAAIAAAYSGAEYDIQTGTTRRRLKRQSLDILLRRKGELELAIERLSGNGARGVRHGMPER